jgi:hypothetical protein
MRPHPLFAGFVGAALEYRKQHARTGAQAGELAELAD